MGIIGSRRGDIEIENKQQDNWRQSIAPYEKPVIKHSIWQLVNTIVPFITLWVLAYLSLTISYWLAFALTIPAAGFLIRIFIIFHDCGHHSFFKSRRANEIVGTITGILTYCPYQQWKYTHSVHHATSSNLNKRGTGDIWTLTVAEYLSLSPMRRMFYRIYRNPFVMLGIGPFYTFLIEYRFNRKGAGRKERINTYITNLGIVGLSVLLGWLLGWQQYLVIHGLIFFISSVAGIWLFYVQHNFENTYFEKEEDWDYVSAALKGSSFYNLPKILHWITGNIGFHHIHHLSPRVPNYYLQRVHANNPFLQKVTSISMVSSLRSLRYRVWNEQSKKFVGFRDIKMERE